MINEVKLTDGKVVKKIKEKTRGIAKQFNKILYGNSKVDMSGDIQVQAFNMELANDYLIREMTGLSESEIDNLLDTDYQKVLLLINGIKTEEEKKK